MATTSLLLLLTLLFTKHFIADFLLQTPYQFLNKGTYGHPGGLLHSGIQAAFTAVVVIPFAPLMALALALFDFAVHYHVDWAKVQLNNKYSWKPDTHKEFWWLLGLDQFLHSLTYIAIAWIVVSM